MYLIALSLNVYKYFCEYMLNSVDKIIKIMYINNNS